MTREEAEKIIREYNPPKPIKYYYNDPYADGKFNSSGWVYEYPPVSGALIDAILERDKDCKEYIPDSECETDEKFNQEMEKKFTDLMSRAKDTAVEEYRKNNQHLYSMSTKVNGKYITIIPMQLMTEVEFKEKASSACETLQLNNYQIYRHINESDKDGHEIFKSSPLSSGSITDATKTAFSDALRYCDYIKKHTKESSNYEIIEGLCDGIKDHIESLYKIIELDYMQRINNYTEKERLSGKNYE